MISLKSEITKKLLNYFLFNPEDSLYVNEIARKLGMDKRNLVKKIKELENEGMIHSTQRGNLKLISLNKDYPLLNEYRNIVCKTVGIEVSLKKIVSDVSGIEKAYIFGSYARNTMDSSSDVDLLIVGSHSVISLQRKISILQKEIGREINVVNMTREEFNKRQKSKDAFILEVLKNKHIEII